MMEKRVSISHRDWSILFFILILSFVNLSSSQMNPPRNIETFYPGINTSTPSRSGASRKAIMMIVGAAIASTFVLSIVFFILFTRFSSYRRSKEAGSGRNNKSSLQSAMEATGSKSEYKKLGKNAKEQYNMVANNASGKKPPIVPRARSSASSTTQFLPQQGSHVSSGEGDQKPPFSVTTIPKAPLVVPPTSPSVLEKKVATVPPPPPPSTKVLVPPPLPKTYEGSGRVREEASGSGNGQVKLKALHWEKLNINSNQSMVWDEIGKGSFQYNDEMMEALFNAMATNHKHPKKPYSAREPSNSNPRIFILNSRKSQNIAIVIKSLGISLDELIDALLQGKGLVADILEKLTRMAPTGEEASQIMSFSGDPVKLADAEFFLYGLLKAVPWAFSRVDEMLFRLRYGSEILSLNESLQMTELACNELKNNRIFLKLLEAILKAGNRLNAGTARGDAKAFNLNTLKKLSNFKSMDGKTTLLHFVVHEVVRSEGRRCVLARSNNISQAQNNESSGAQYNDPTTKEERETEFLKLGLHVVGTLSLEFLNVKKAASIDYDTFKATLDSLARKVREARQLIGNNESTDGGSGFLIERIEFFESAEVEIKAIEEEHTRVINLVKTTTEYFQAGGLNEKSPLQLFVIVRDFLGMVDQTCDEITRSSNQKKQAIVEVPSTISEAS